MNFTNMKVGTRLILGFSTVLIFLLAVAGLGINRMALIKAKMDDITQVNQVEMQLAASMRVTVYDRLIAVRNLALLSDTAQMQPEAERIKMQAEKYAKFEETLGKMLSTISGTTPDEKALFAKVQQAGRATVPLMMNAAELGLANKNEEATAVLLKQVRPQQTLWLGALNELIDFEAKLNTEAVAESEQAYATARNAIIALGCAALITGALIAFFITHGLLKQLGGEPGYAADVAGKIASGDLAVQIDTRSNDRTSMMYAMKQMRDSLAAIVGQVRAGTETIASASAQVAVGSQDLSSRTEEQASSLEETASSMEELTSTVKQNADNARQANMLADAASGVAQKGGSVISEVVKTMEEINSSASKITDIIGVIDGIAFQTNILALNAAVEAARAGEQGRGFAVVASEVRTLAQRSASAAKEIKSLIDDSVEKVGNGSRQVNEAGATMREIVESVKRVTDIMAEITAASQEQTTGIEQINQAITQMDEVTQQNAALVEEAAAAAESMQDQAAKLSRVVGAFKVDGSPAIQAPAHTKPSHAGVAKTTARPARALPAATRRDTVQKQLATSKSGSADDWEEF